MLLAQPRPDGSLAFALSSWTPDGSNFGVGGIALRSGTGWAYRDLMNSPDPKQRCGIDIQLDGKGTYRVSTVEGARCEANAGHGAVLYGMDVFPPGSRVGAAPSAFLDDENLTRIGCDRPSPGRAHFECPASLDGHRVLNWNLFDGSQPVPQQLAKDGSGTVVWTINPAQTEGGGVRIICGYRDTPKVREFALGPEIRRCSNPQMSRAFDCN